MSLLEVDALTIRFGGVTALDAIGFDVNAGQICGLIGPNGAGKTTLFNCISNLYQSDSGEIRIDGIATTGKKPSRLAAMGVGRTFQNVALFPDLTAAENVMVGQHVRSRCGFLQTAFGSSRSRRDEISDLGAARDLLKLVGLGSKLNEKASSLSFGDQKRIELARALATKPSLLLLDEPAGGLNPTERVAFEELIRRIRRDFQLAILIVEHHMGLVMALCEKVVVLNFGKKIAEGEPHEIQASPAVIQAYLGKSHR